MSSRPRALRVPFVGLCSAVVGCAFAAGGNATADAAEVASEAWAIIQANCLKCHGPGKQQGGLRFDSRSGVLAAGDSGSAAVMPGQPDAGELISRLTSSDASARMPPGDAGLTAQQIETLRQWIKAGAPWPREATAGATAQRSELNVTDDDRQHWSFQPLGKITPPASMQTDQPIDRFILAKLSAAGLTLSNPATRERLIRRVTFDLTGLPPTPEDVQAFAHAADFDTAYQALVDRLLASSHYGERWGRHWLDVAHYADSDGYESDEDRPHAYHFRDYVIQSLNNDMPFDLFVRQQLAGDELQPDDPRALSATGFLAAGPSVFLPEKFIEEERLRQRYNELDDMVSTTGLAFLGLTLGCARCHDHKFDPVPTRDYYRLLAALHSGDRAQVSLGTRSEVAANELARAQWNQERTTVESRLKSWLDEQQTPLVQRLRREKIDKLPIDEAEKTILVEQPDSPMGKALAKKHQPALTIADDEWRAVFEEAVRKRWDELAGAVTAVRKREPKALPVALAFRDTSANPAESWLFGRGDFYDHSTPVELGFLTVLTHDKSAADYWKNARAEGARADTTHQRRALADWLTDAEQGAGALLARVIVNRVWQHHFGAGLVRTPNDFGTRGDRPSHPELLDWLAADLVAHDWKLKRLHRLILLSATYRQGSSSDAEALKADPDNRLLSRMRPIRLEVEAIRDAMLAVSGTLNPAMYGPAFKPAIPPEAMVARNLKNPYPTNVADGPAVWRRSVYMFHKRVVPYPLFQAFDAPDAQQCVGQRNVTTVAPQALAVLNDPFVRARAGDFASRLRQEVGDDPPQIVARAYQVAFGRWPTDSQTSAGVQFLARQRQTRSARDPQADAEAIQKLALTDYCQALFGLNEFIYVD